MRNSSRLPRPLLEAYEWQDRGACREVASALFFEPDNDRGAGRTDREERAKQVCGRCPVIVECRAHGLAAEDYGIWGGLTALERETMRHAGRHSAA